MPYEFFRFSLVNIYRTLTILARWQTGVHFAVLWLASAGVFVYVGIVQSGFGGLIVNP
jgi:hypothetical protein